MHKRREIRRYGLYGEGKGLSGTEFVHIERISKRSSLHNWSIAPHVHPGIFQLLLLQEGEGILAVDGAEHALHPQMLVIVPCGNVHGFRFKPATEGWVLSLADTLVDDRRLAALDVAGLMRGPRVTWHSLDATSTPSRLLGALLAEIANRHAAAPGQLTTGLIAIIGLVLNLARELSEASVAELAEGLDRRITLVRRFSRLVDENMREGWSVARYARELGTSAPSLTRACREVAGMAPAELVLDRRLREAKRALSYTDVGIGMISDDLGFTDAAHFARVFRRSTGKTASAYRRENFWLA